MKLLCIASYARRARDVGPGRAPGGTRAPSSAQPGRARTASVAVALAVSPALTATALTSAAVSATSRARPGPAGVPRHQRAGHRRRGRRPAGVHPSRRRRIRRTVPGAALRRPGLRPAADRAALPRREPRPEPVPGQRPGRGGGRQPAAGAVRHSGAAPVLPGVTITSSGAGTALRQLTAAGAQAFGAALARQPAADHASGGYSRYGPAWTPAVDRGGASQGDPDRQVTRPRL